MTKKFHYDVFSLFVSPLITCLLSLSCHTYVTGNKDLGFDGISQGGLHGAELLHGDG